MYISAKYYYLRKFLSVKEVFKYFIGYKNDKKVRPICAMLPKMTAYRKDFDETKYMFLFHKKC